MIQRGLGSVLLVEVIESSPELVLIIRAASGTDDGVRSVRSLLGTAETLHEYPLAMLIITPCQTFVCRRYKVSGEQW